MDDFTFLRLVKAAMALRDGRDTHTKMVRRLIHMIEERDWVMQDDFRTFGIPLESARKRRAKKAKGEGL